MLGVFMYFLFNGVHEMKLLSREPPVSTALNLVASGPNNFRTETAGPIENAMESVIDPGRSSENPYGGGFNIF